jgi:hypothetical protein
MNPVIGQSGPVAVIVGGCLLGIYFQNRRFDSMNRRFDDLRELLKSESSTALDRLCVREILRRRPTHVSKNVQNDSR